MNSSVVFAKSQQGGEIAIYESRTRPGHTYSFVVKKRGRNGDIAVRCQKSMATNTKYRKDGNVTKAVPYLWIKDSKWTADPDNPPNAHFCIEDDLVNTSTARTVARQVYRKAAQSCDIDAKKPKHVHNEMAASVRDEIVNFNTAGDIDDLHRAVNRELPNKLLSRRAFTYHNAKSYDRIDNAFAEIPDELKSALSPRPFYGNSENGNRWIIFHEQDPDNEPMIILATVTGLACLRDVVHISCDGNFKYNPNSESTPFVQMYSMHSIYQNLPERSESVLSVVALLASKTRATYVKLFKKVRDAMVEEFGDTGVEKRFHFDMEFAAMNACHEVFSGCQITTCYFHFAKNIMDKVKKIGLINMYTDQEDRSFYDWIRIFIGSAMLPRNVYDEKLRPYMESNFPNGHNPIEAGLLLRFREYMNYWFRHRMTWDQYENDGPNNQSC